MCEVCILFSIKNSHKRFSINQQKVLHWEITIAFILIADPLFDPAIDTLSHQTVGKNNLLQLTCFIKNDFYWDISWNSDLDATGDEFSDDDQDKSKSGGQNGEISSSQLKVEPISSAHLDVYPVNCVQLQVDDLQMSSSVHPK